MRFSVSSLSSLLLMASAATAATTANTVTFNKDVLPILQNNCQGCHRPGEAAPMSFLDYKSTRPWAKAIKAAVATKKMPPWYADPHFGKFSNARLLTTEQIAKLTVWADTGAPEGNPADAPAPVRWVDGWNIGDPQKVFTMPEKFPIPAQGTVEYQYVVLPTGFTQDMWIQRAEVRPGNRALVHHVIAFVRPPGSKWLADAEPGVAFVPGRSKRSRNSEGGDGGMTGVELLVGYAPGLQPQVAEPGKAKFVKAGSDIVLQLHYTANGTPGDDQTKIGLIFAPETPKQRLLTVNATNAKFIIPAGDPNYEVKSSITLQDDTELVWLMPHMHLRGKDFVYRAVYPTGEEQTLLSVPHYDFNWQLAYQPEKPIVLPKGTRIDCTAHFDNSANNPANPDPKKEVRWGDQSWEEMMIGWFDIAIDAKADPISIFKPRQKTSD